MKVRVVAALAALAGAWIVTPAAVAAQWSTPSKLRGVKALRAVSCSSRSFCIAVGGRQAVVFSSGRWQSPRTIDSHSGTTKGLVTVSCVSSKFCVAGDGVGDVFVYDGKRWSSPTLTAATGLLQLSCGARTFCEALGINGDVLAFNGSSWSQPQRISAGSQGLAISCPVLGFCMAMDFTGGYRLSGAKWVSAGAIHPSQPAGGSEPNVPSAVSCAGRSFCAALDDFGEAFTWSGSKWSRPHRFDGNLLAGSDAVSCRARTSCVAVDDGGFATAWNGTAWSQKQRIDRSGALMDVSCGTARFCIAVDSRGRALVYR